MTWETRLQEAAFTPAGGGRLTFDYEDVAQNVDLRGTAFDFPDSEGTYIQRTGNSSRRYPLRVIFWGPNYDLEAKAFEGALLIQGVGVLEHPIYGTVNAVPFGTVTRRDDLKTASNQTVIDVTFWGTTGVIYPTTNREPGNQVLGAVKSYNTAAANVFAEVTDFDSTVDQSRFLGLYELLLGQTTTTLRPIAESNEETGARFETINDSINQSIDILVDDPVTLAFQTLILIQDPSRAGSSVAARLSAYGGLIQTILGSPNAISTPGLTSSNSNDFHTKDLYTSTYVSGQVLSIVNNTFETKPQALEAATLVLDTFEAVTEWRDENYRSLGEVDTGETYQQIQSAVALAAGFLVDLSFSLKQERRFILDRKRTIVDLCAELYGEVDAVLDFFIDSNDLAWDEMIELRVGREVVYYV